MNTKKTLESILIETRNSILLKEGQVYETMVSIYPSEDISPSSKNVDINGKKVTLPLAVSSKDKKRFNKKESSLKNFYNECLRGDYLLIKEVGKNNSFICENISLPIHKNNIVCENSNSKRISLTKDDITSGKIKRVYRGFKPYLK